MGNIKIITLSRKRVTDIAHKYNTTLITELGTLKSMINNQWKASNAMLQWPLVSTLATIITF